MMKRIAITGFSGFVAGHFLDYLYENDIPCEILGLDRATPKIDLAKCVKCGMCERACKAQSIDIGSGTIDRTTCVACFSCGAVCKKGALTWSR